MSRTFRNKSKKKTEAKATYTLADIRKGRRPVALRLNLDDAYEIAGGYKDADRDTFALAFKMVERDDKEFANSLKKTATPKQRPNLKRLITLYDAYEIAGGYKFVDKEVFELAMKMVENDDPAFAASLRQTSKNSSSEASLQDVSAEQTANNAEFIFNLYEEDKQSNELRDAIFDDKEIKLAFDNTGITETDDILPENSEMAAEVGKSTTAALFENSKAETLLSLCNDKEFADMDNDNKKEKVKSEVKHSLLSNLKALRLKSLFKSKNKEKIKAIKEGNENFFNQAIKDAKDAFDFKKKVKVSGEFIVSALNTTQKKLSSFTKKLTEQAQKAKDGSKKFFSKAAVTMHKAAIYAVMVSTVASSVLSSCSNGRKQTLDMPRSNDTVKVADKQNLDMPRNDTAKITVQQIQGEKAKAEQEAKEETKEEVKATAIIVPDIYDEAMGITEAQWNRQRNYWKDKDGNSLYDSYYKSISEDMLSDGGIFAGKTREQVLFSMERISSWNLTAHHDLIAKLDKIPCPDEQVSLTAEDAQMLQSVMPDGSIKDVEGTLCTRVIDRIGEPCDEMKNNVEELDCGGDKVIVENVVGNTGEQNDSEAPKEQGFKEIVNYTEVVVPNVVENSVPNMEILKTNNMKLDGTEVVVGPMTPEEAARVKAKNKKVVVQLPAASQTGKVETVEENGNEGFVIEQGSSITISEEQAAALLATYGNTGNEKRDSTNSSQVISEAEAAALLATYGNTGNKKKDSTGSSQVISEAEAIAMLSSTSDNTGEGDEGFVIEQGSSITVSEEEAAAILAASGVTSSQNNNNSSDTSNSSMTITEEEAAALLAQLPADSISKISGRKTKEKIVANSDTLAVGTLSAGNVPQRGGVGNSGLTQEQLDYSKKIIKDKFGKSAYKTLMDNISDEMLSKGNVFEGLTREQALYNFTVWCVVYPHSQETTILFDYLSNCHEGETMPDAEKEKVKTAMDRIHINKTIDDVTYTKPIRVTSVTNNGCDEPVSITTVTGKEATVNPGGPKFPKLFKLPWNVAKEGVIETVSYREKIVEHVVEEPLQDFVVYRTNNCNFDGTEKAIGSMTPEEVAGVEPENRKVLVQVTGASQESAEEAKGRVSQQVSKRNKRTIRRAEKEAKKRAKQQAQARADALRNSPTGNLELDKWLSR